MDNLGFGQYYTDHMFEMDYTEGIGWHDPRIVPYHKLEMDPAKIAEIIELVTSGKINRTAAKEVFEAVFKENVDPDKYIEEHDLVMVDNSDEVEAIITQVINDNPKSIEDLKAGKAKARGFLVGQTMKALKGKANPQTVNKILDEKLAEIL